MTHGSSAGSVSEPRDLDRASRRRRAIARLRDEFAALLDAPERTESGSRGRFALIVDAVVALLLSGVVGFPILIDTGGSITFVPALIVPWLLLIGAVALRRVLPVVSLGAALAAMTLKLVFGAPVHPLDASFLLLLYSTAARANLVCVAIAAVAAIVVPVVTGIQLVLVPLDIAIIGPLTRPGAGTGSPSSMVVYALVLTFVALLVFLLGLIVRMRQRARALRRSTELIELERSRAEERLVLERERIDIARDMHDIVAHSLAVIIAQADGGRYVMRTDPETAEEVFRTISDTAREALVDVRGLLAQLRHHPAQLPNRDLGDLETLVQRVRRSGLGVDLAIEGPPRDLGRAVGIAAYRLVQEALTNAMRHGTSNGRNARVEILWGTRLTIRVWNAVDAVETAKPQRRGGGHGLVGMRERLVSVGGTVSTGPFDGGYLVYAVLPIPKPQTGPVRRDRPASSRHRSTRFGASIADAATVAARGQRPSGSSEQRPQDDVRRRSVGSPGD